MGKNHDYSHTSVLNHIQACEKYVAVVHMISNVWYFFIKFTDILFLAMKDSVLKSESIECVAFNIFWF